MSKIPYHLGDTLKEVTAPPFLLQCFDILIRHNGLAVSFMSSVVHKKGKTGKWPDSLKPETVLSVLKHVVFRTLPFGKVFEFIRVKDIIYGMPSIAVAATSLKKRAIQKALTMLVSDHWLIKLELPRQEAVTPLYGLNLPVLMEFVKAWWGAALTIDQERKDPGYEYYDRQKAPGNYIKDDGELRPTSLLARQAWDSLDKVIPELEPYEPLFKFLRVWSKPIRDMEAFKAECYKRLPDKVRRERLRTKAGILAKKYDWLRDVKPWHDKLSTEDKEQIDEECRRSPAGLNRRDFLKLEFIKLNETYDAELFDETERYLIDERREYQKYCKADVKNL